jgi:hypothetical protein
MEAKFMDLSLKRLHIRIIELEWSSANFARVSHPSDQAEAIRDVLGIRKRTELGPDELERRRALGKTLALGAGRANAGARLPTRKIRPRATGHGPERVQQLACTESNFIRATRRPVRAR